MPTHSLSFKLVGSLALAISCSHGSVPEVDGGSLINWGFCAHHNNSLGVSALPTGVPHQANPARPYHHRAHALLAKHRSQHPTLSVQALLDLASSHCIGVPVGSTGGAGTARRQLLCGSACQWYIRDSAMAQLGVVVLRKVLHLVRTELRNRPAQRHTMT